MTVCNMSIEWGARAGHDRSRRDDVRLPRGPRPRAAGRRLGRRRRRLGRAAHRRGRHLRRGGRPRRRAPSRRSSPGAPTPVRASPSATSSPTRPSLPAGGEREAAERALDYMGLTAGTPMREIAVDTVFLGSCTNGRMEDLRAAAEVVRGRHVADGMRAMVVPGSMLVKLQAEQEGLDEVFRAAGFDWRNAGCSMCLGMNPDTLQPGRALRLDVEPQLRGTAGPRRPHAPRQPARSPPPPPSPAACRRRPTCRRPDVDAFTTHTGTRRPAAPQRRRHRPDHPERLAQAGRAHRLRRGPVQRVARRPRLRARAAAVRGRQRPGRRRELRHRLLARARRLGAAGLRLPPPSSARGSATSSATTPSRAGCVPVQLQRGRGRAALGAGRGRPARSRSRSTSAPASCAPATSSPPSRSTTSPAGGSWRAWTTSG